MHLNNKLLLIVFVFFAVTSSYCQNDLWTKRATNKFELHNDELRESLSKITIKSTYTEIVFPSINGDLKLFKIYDNAVLPEKLAKKYPQVHSYKGHEKFNKQKQIRFTCNSKGLEATLIYNDQIVNLTRGIDNIYELKSNVDAKELERSFECGTLKGVSTTSVKNNSFGRSGKFVESENINRTVRLAITTTGEVSDFFIDKNGLQSASEIEQKAAVLAGISNSVNNVNVAFERDLGVRFNLIENNDELIFLNSETDPFDDDGDLFLLIDQGRNTIDNIIPFEDYDMGHLISLSGSGGLASVGGICSDFKADAVTGFFQPEGFFFDFTLFAHELGHQLGGRHTQSANCQIEDPVEAGSGTTIMGYSGACGINNVQPESDAFFHSQSIEQIFDRLSDIGNDCGVAVSPVNNALPELPQFTNYVVPVGLPLYFDAEVTDQNSQDNLTYSWEQYDQEFGASPPEETSDFGPQFRVYPPIENSRRDFPTSGVNSLWEVLPLVERTMNFRLLVRDGNPGGVVISDIIQLQLVNHNQEFKIPEENGALVFNQNEETAIKWDVAGTNLSPFNVAQVKIEYSYDGGITYPIILAESTANTGAATVVFPNEDIGEVDLDNGKIRISALDNAFYTFTNEPISLREFPTTTVFSRQDLREDLLLFKINTSFSASKDIDMGVSFRDSITNFEIDFSNELLVSSDMGSTFFAVENETITLKQGESEIWLGLPLREVNDTQNQLDEVILTLTIPDGSSNLEATATGKIIKKKLSINENLSFQNPTKGIVNFTALQRQLQDYDIKIYNVNGALIRNFKFGKNDQEFIFDDFSSGLYIVSIALGEELATKKLIVF